MKTVVLMLLACFLVQAADKPAIIQQVQAVAMAGMVFQSHGEYISHDEKTSPEGILHQPGPGWHITRIFNRPILIRESSFIIVGRKRIWTFGSSASKEFGFTFKIQSDSR